LIYLYTTTLLQECKPLKRFFLPFFYFFTGRAPKKRRNLG